MTTRRRSIIAGPFIVVFFTLLSFTYNLHGKFRTAQKPIGQIALSAEIYTVYSAQCRNLHGMFLTVQKSTRPIPRSA